MGRPLHPHPRLPILRFAKQSNEQWPIRVLFQGWIQGFVPLTATSSLPIYTEFLVMPAPIASHGRDEEQAP